MSYELTDEEEEEIVKQYGTAYMDTDRPTEEMDTCSLLRQINWSLSDGETERRAEIKTELTDRVDPPKTDGCDIAGCSVCDESVTDPVIVAAHNRYVAGEVTTDFYKNIVN